MELALKLYDDNIPLDAIASLTRKTIHEVITAKYADITEDKGLVPLELKKKEIYHVAKKSYK